MEQGLILLVAALMVFVAPGIQGTAHLSFVNNTEVNITRAGCGVTKLCVETPNGCDPAGNDSCLFVSVVASTPVAPRGSNLSIELRGKSQGYIALGLAADASMGTTMLFVCGQNKSANGTFIFRTVQRNNTNNELKPVETRVTDIRSKVKDDVIRCEFNVPGVNASNTRSNDATTFSILLGNGTFDGDAVGAFNTIFKSSPLNITNPASNITSTTAPTTAATTITTINTTSGANSVLHLQALLLLSVVSLSVTQRA